MGGEQMDGDNEERRALATAARDAGKQASEIGASTGASQQRAEADPEMTHQQRLDLEREGKHNVLSANTPEARPRSRDDDSEKRESHPRL